MAHPFEELSKSCHSDEDLAKISYECNIILKAMEVLVPSPETKRKISKHLYEALQRAISKNDGTTPSTDDKLALGNGFQYLVQDSDLQEPLMNLWPSLCKVAGLYGHLLNYWESLLSLAEKELAWWKSNRTFNVKSSYTNKTYTVYRYAVANTAPRPEVMLLNFATQPCSPLLHFLELFGGLSNY